MSPVAMDLTGRTFGEWTVIRFGGKRGSVRGWECRCSCGTEQWIPGKELTAGQRMRCKTHFKKDGSKVGYQAIHSRLYARRGRASNYTCTCGRPAEQWSYDGGAPDERVVSNPGWDGSVRQVRISPSLDYYTPLCRSCHIRRDQAAVG